MRRINHLKTINYVQVHYQIHKTTLTFKRNLYGASLQFQFVYKKLH